MERVSTKRDYHHNDVHYFHQGLINEYTKMFNHYLNTRKNGKRLYHSTDGILDIPKTKLYDSYYGRPNGKSNIRRVKAGCKNIRKGVNKFLNSKIVKHCCVGSFANIEHTVYRPIKTNKRTNQKYRAKYVIFHPHVHVTFITKPHKSFSLDENSLKANKLSKTRTKLSNKTQTGLSRGDDIQLNKEWNKDINAKYNHFYLKPTYIKSNNPNQHVRAYWSAGWGNYSKSLKPFCHAKPNSRVITDNDSPKTVYKVAHDLASESNKYRGTEAKFVRQLKHHDYKNAMKIQDKYHSNISHGMLAVEMGWFNNRKNYPRHMYAGSLHQYAKKHIFPKYPAEARADELPYLNPNKSAIQPTNSNRIHEENTISNNEIKLLSKMGIKPKPSYLHKREQVEKLKDNQNKLSVKRHPRRNNGFHKTNIHRNDPQI